MESQLQKIKDAGLPLSFDFSDDSEDAYYEKIAPLVTYAFCSFPGTEEETMEHLKKVASYGPKIVCASRGAKGCMLYAGGRFYTQEAVPLQEVVDTMGAGDSLITTFMVGYLDAVKKGVEEETAIRQSIEKAEEFASKTCQMEGAFGYGREILMESLRA